MSDDDLSDEQLEALLADALEEADPVPAHVHDAALAAFAFCDLDSALAELVAEEVTGVRTDSSGVLVFAADDVEIAVEVAEERCLGQVSPPGGWSARLERAQGPGQDLVLDELGRFELEAPGGPVRVVVQGPGRSLRTAWFHL